MTKDKALKRLGYTEEWLSDGIISEEYLLAQYEEIEVSEDKNAEHYRCGGFSEFLDSKKELTEDQIAAVFKLKDNGPDQCNLHENRIIELIHSKILDDKQLDSISKYPEVLERPIQKRYLREKLIRKINRTSVADCFDEIKVSGDSHVQKYILQRHDLKLEHVTWLTKNGSNKKLRNQASQLCNSKRFRKKHNKSLKRTRKPRRLAQTFSLNKMKIFSTTLLIATSLLISSSPCIARDLAGINWNDFRTRSELVFSGTLVKAELIQSRNEISYVYQVHRIFKGEKPTTISFRAPFRENINKTVGTIAIVALRKEQGDWILSVDERSCWPHNNELKEDFGGFPVYEIPTVLLYDFPKELGKQTMLKRRYQDGFHMTDCFVFPMQKIDENLEEHLKN